MNSEVHIANNENLSTVLRPPNKTIHFVVRKYTHKIRSLIIICVTSSQLCKNFKRGTQLKETKTAGVNNPRCTTISLATVTYFQTDAGFK